MAKINGDMKKVLGRMKQAQSQLETIIKDSKWVDDAKKVAKKSGKEVQKRIQSDVTRVKTFLEKEAKELEKIQTRLPAELKKLQGFIKGQRKEFTVLMKNLRKKALSKAGAGRRSSRKKSAQA